MVQGTGEDEGWRKQDTWRAIQIRFGKVREAGIRRNAGACSEMAPSSEAPRRPLVTQGGITGDQFSVMKGAGA